MKKYATVAELLKDKRRWTNDGDVAVTSKNRFCIATAIHEVYGHKGDKFADTIAEQFRQQVMPSDCLAAWNDSHTHAEVLAAVRKAKI